MVDNGSEHSVTYTDVLPEKNPAAKKPKRKAKEVGKAKALAHGTSKPS